MEITVTKKHTQTINVPVPCYWFNGIRWIGLIDEKNAITFADYGDQVEIKNLTGNLLNSYLADTQELENYALITEETFFEAYDVIMKSLTIIPILKTW